jgi:hypothetical protein
MGPMLIVDGPLILVYVVVDKIDGGTTQQSTTIVDTMLPLLWMPRVHPGYEVYRRPPTDCYVFVQVKKGVHRSTTPLLELPGDPV